MKMISRLSLVAATGILLSGCSLFSGNQLADFDSGRASEVATAETVADIQLEVGRENLADGNLAAAARYLRGARLHPKTMADATNALDVVYIRLGRLDVAQRYFAEAVDLEPDNARFITNLARIERDVSFARLRSNDRIEELAAQSALAAAPVEQSMDATESRDASRRSPAVFHIRTTDNRDHAPAEMQVFNRRPVVQVAERDEVQEDTTETEREPTRFKVVDYPVRLEI